MTTIVYSRRDRMLAADSQCGMSNGATGQATKIWAMGNVAIAVAGYLEEGILMKEYFFDLLADNDCEPPHIEETTGLTVQFGPGKRISAFGMTPKGCMMIPVEDDFISFGSGSGFAMGALACGKTAIEAIKIASKFDPHTNSRVLYFNGDKIRRA